MSTRTPDDEPPVEHPRPAGEDTPAGRNGSPSPSAGDDTRPAPLDRQVAVALDTLDTVLDAVEKLTVRVSTLEGSAGEDGSLTGPRRSVFRFAETAPDQDQGPEALQEAVRRAMRAWQALHAWVDWLVATYRLHQLIPTCWPQHPQLVEELVGLYISWRAAWRDDGPADAIVVFHERLYRARDRWLDANWGNQCRAARHDVGGIDNGDNYRSWADAPGRDAALRAARDRSIVLLKGAPHPRHHRPATHGTGADSAETTGAAADGAAADGAVPGAVGHGVHTEAGRQR